MGYGFGYGMNMGYVLILVLSLGLGGITQWYINKQYKIWSQVPVSSGETGADVARRMLAQEGAGSVGITAVDGHLTDFYDPRDNQLHLSQENITGGTVASVAVACHEAGHAVQTARGFVPVKIRTALVPVVNFASQTWMLVFLAGAFLGITGLYRLAIILFAFSVLFQLVTLPVEFDASRRAVAYIGTMSGLSPDAERGARKVLTAAALTYVAAALVSIVQLLYYIGMTNNRD
ncbi:MAG: zinc metallopeptidase [Atopobiaceae bacterium]|jgi:Zn-dependent membrane protease YugP|nr:zinc metallopeptidase [Atopobiaceae bacterium]